MNKETDLKTITNEEIKAAYKYQQKIGWTFNDEKELTDTIFNSRFNFLLVAYTLFLNIYFLAGDKNEKLSILVIGLLIISFLYIPIHRAYTRYNYVINILCSIDDKETTPIILHGCANKRILKILPPSVVTGYIIPIIMILSFIAGIIHNCLDKLKWMFQ